MSPDSNTWGDRIINSPVYIVLDVPSPVAEKIQSFREKFDPARAALPVEITLTGSCGTWTDRQGDSGITGTGGKTNSSVLCLL